eukprot:Gb_00561 [translate_table: standard]
MRITSMFLHRRPQLSFPSENFHVCTPRRSSQRRTLKGRSMPDGDLRIATSIIFSAFFYFFDFATNIEIAIAYYKIDTITNRSKDTDYPYPQDTEKQSKLNSYDPGCYGGTFVAIISIMVAAHISSALIFFFNLETRREAVKAAFFLPLIHLRRLGLLAWRTGALRGVKDLSSEKLSSIYNVVAASMESAPQIFLQLHVFFQLDYHGKGFHPQKKYAVISIVASFLSVVYNCSQASMVAMGKANYIGKATVALTSAMYASTSMAVRLFGLEAFIQQIRFNSSTPIGLPGLLQLTGANILLYVPATLGIPTLVFWRELEKDEGSAASLRKRLLLSLTFGYMSFLTGPLNVLVELNKNRKININKDYRTKFVELSLIRILPDVLFGLISGTIYTHCRPYYREEKFDCFRMLMWFGCSVGAHIISIILVIVGDKYTKNDQQVENDGMQTETAVHERRRLRQKAEEGRESIQNGTKFTYDRSQGCFL